MDLTYQKQVKMYESQLSKGLSNADKFINRTYLANLNDCEVVELDVDKKKTNSIRFFEITKIVYDKEEICNDKLISVYSALQNVGAETVVMLRGSEDGVKYYIGINSDTNVSVSENTLQKSFTANFPGSELIRKTNPQIEEILDASVFFDGSCSVSNVTVVPSVRDEDKEKFFQGIEKFIDAMRGDNYTALFIARPVSTRELNNRKSGLEALYTSLSPFSKTTLAYGENESLSIAEGVSENFSKTVNDSVSKTLGKNYSENESDTKGSNQGFNLGMSIGTNKGKTKGYSEGTSSSEAVTSGSSETTGTGTSKTDTTTTGTSKTYTVESINKTAEVVLKKIDSQLERIKNCESFGVWEASAYFISEKVQVSIVAANTYKALVCGEESNVENAYVNIWNQHNPQSKRIVEYLKYCRHPLFSVYDVDGENRFEVTPANYISGKELPIFMGLPQKSVNGVSVSEMAEFSRNVFIKDAGVLNNTTKKIHLGCIHHMGVNEESNIVNLDLNSFTSHCFITGSTGSGKSNTVYQLLDNFIVNKIPFLVIEPAKGEYKKDFGGVEGVNIFTSNPYMGAMLKINPFAFPENIHVLEHLDRLIEIFNACWEMYAAMPAILKSAVEKAYIDKGWDLINSIYTKGDMVEFPTFADVLRTLPNIISVSGYSSDTQGDYTGALVTRVASLTNGISGQMFCDNYFVEDSVLFDENTIVDLSRIGSAETKSLIMGILVMKLTEYRMANATGTNKELSHITILEEAHNLLKNVSQSQGQESANPIGKSVEMICNSIAEMRTYGEGFIIVDQSPTSVDIAAIKNTNTKIVMRLPEKQDCEAVGNSLGLKDNQIAELAKLPVGVAAVMQNNWLEAVLCKVNKASNKYFKENTVISYGCLKDLRSKLISQMIMQFEFGCYDFNAFIDVVNSFDLPRELKNEYLSRCKAMYNNLYKKDNPSLLSDEFLNISGLKFVFDINEIYISPNYNSTSLKEWRNNVLLQMQESLSLKYLWQYNFLFEWLLYAMSGKKTNIDYWQIIKKLKEE